MRKFGVNHGEVSYDIKPQENPFLREVVYGSDVKLEPETHPISRDLDADSFTIENLNESGITGKASRPLLRQSFEQRLNDLEAKLYSRAAYIESESLKNSVSNNVIESNNSVENETNS